MCKIMNKILKELGISEKVYGEMQELCPNINELSDDEIMNKVNILKQINCNDMQIKNIVSSNVQYLDRSENDIQKLISKMKETGFTTLNILFDGNPYILNLDDFEIENYIENRAKEGEKVEDIVDDLESNPYSYGVSMRNRMGRCRIAVNSTSAAPHSHPRNRKKHIEFFQSPNSVHLSKNL